MRGAGRVVFAGIVLVIVGTLNIIYGIGALDDANYFANDTRYVLTNLNALGWVLIILGVIQLTGGFSLLAGNPYGRVIGIVGGSRRRDRRPALDRPEQPVVVARHLLPLRLRRLRNHRVRRGREKPSDSDVTVAGARTWFGLPRGFPATRPPDGGQLRTRAE